MELRNKLAVLKEKHGATNQQIADGTGIPLGTVSGIFSGQTARPAFQDVVEILRFFGVSADEFCGLAPKPSPETENAPQPGAAAEHHYHHFSFVPLKSDVRELTREAIAEVHSSDAYRIIDKHLKWWRAVSIALIALVVIWFTWDITHPDVGLIQYSSALPVQTGSATCDLPARV